MGERREKLKSLLALNTIPGLGARRIRILLDHFKDPEEIFKCGRGDLLVIEGIGQASALSILSFDRWDETERVLDRLSSSGIKMMGLTDDDYPPLLKQIFDPPSLLWIRGSRSALSLPGIAVVGTREPSRYGKETTVSLGKELSEAGMCINSGLAYGIDTIAHHTALRCMGKTVAVLGSGIDRIYPGRNRFLVKQIVESGGAVITEFPPGTKPDAGNFPVRNRIVSGLSVGVLIVESGVQGGSMITAEQALDQNREVFAVPHPLKNISGSGCNYLIKTGAAKLVQGVGDILEEIPGYNKQNKMAGRKPSLSRKNQDWRKESLNGLQQQICECLSEEQIQIDHLAEKLELDTGKLLVSLLELEMRDLVVQRAGKIFALRE
ncbi:DNA-processing protein DprA [Balneola sp. MJW-20]|uniref:DNA-processing protein DprA n=1 Tax=Gracilimonas aurantiaca TaxID=3234185 RepID=UPI003466BF62